MPALALLAALTLTASAVACASETLVPAAIVRTPTNMEPTKERCMQNS
jgi:hypothetical protein